MMHKAWSSLENVPYYFSRSYVKFQGHTGKSERFDSLVIFLNWIQIINFSDCVTLKFDGWPWKTMGHLFYTTSSFLHHFKAIGKVTGLLRGRSWVRPWDPARGVIPHGCSPYHTSMAVGKGLRCLVHAPVGKHLFKALWPLLYMRLPLTWNKCHSSPIIMLLQALCIISLWAISEIKLSNQSGNAQFGSKFMILTIDGCPWKNKGHCVYAASNFVHHFITISEIKLE